MTGEAMEKNHGISHIHCRSIIVQIGKAVRRIQLENEAAGHGFGCCGGGNAVLLPGPEVLRPA